MELYLARHGQTAWNAAGRTQGNADIDLNATGRKDAKLLGETLKDMKFDAVYSSPLKRAYNTAKIALKGRDMDIIIDDRIREMGYGVLEGSSFKEMLDKNKNPKQGTYISEPEKYIPPEGGESFDDVDKRVGSFLSEIVSKYPEDAKVLLFAHGAVNMCMLRHLRKQDVSKMWSSGIQANGEIMKITLDKDGNMTELLKEKNEVLITFAVPCYNSEAYMKTCIDSLLVAGSEAEIIIIDDGSTDQTAAIADSYAERFKERVKVIHQENKGHGGAVNTGIRHAKGKYFKVVDSDDWLEMGSLTRLINVLRRFVKERRRVDMVITNYVYEHALDDVPTSKVISYTNCFPEEEVIPWSKTGRFGQGQNLLMHAICYRTRILRESGLMLPEHTFYVDNLYAYVPLPFVKSIYYLNADLYRYFIGREDQSVNESVMIKRIDQQIRVNRLMVEAYKLPDDVKNPKCRKYMVSYLAMISLVTSAMLTISGIEENLKKRDDFFKWFREEHPETYKEIKGVAKGRSATLRGPLGNTAIRIGYKISQKIFKFN